MFDVSVVIPTYNEAKNLPMLLEEIWNIVDKSKIDIGRIQLVGPDSADPQCQIDLETEFVPFQLDWHGTSNMV